MSNNTTDCRESFAKIKKVERSPFDPFVKWFFPKLVPFIPKWFTPNRISFIGIFGAVLCGLTFYLTNISPLFYIAGALLILFTWSTDTLDGIVARARKLESLAGAYIDHFGDPIATLFISFGLFSSKGSHIYIGACFMIIYLFLVIQFHVMAPLTNVMEIPFFGPTELRLAVAATSIISIFVRNPLVIINNTGFSLIDVMGAIGCLGCFVVLVAGFFKSIHRLKEAEKKDD
jgi:phosphatidylglycerophosphate synthase